MFNGQRYFTEGSWYFDLIGKNIWKITYKGASNITYIAMTGSDVTTELHIPFPHRWNSTHFRHADSSNDDSNAKLTITIRRAKTKNTPAQFEEDMFHIANYQHVKLTELWGEMFEREASTYNVIMNSTSTDRIYLVFYIQKLGD